MNKNLNGVLFRMANILNQTNITWAIGASMMLNLSEIDIDVHDIDIMVSQDDFALACNALIGICDEIRVEESNLFRTKQFKRYVCDGIEIDIMSGMGIIHKLGFFEYQFKKEDIEKVMYVDSTRLPLCYIEDWYIFYHLMSNRYTTLQKIERYFNEKTFNPTRFSNLLDLSIPFHIRLLLTELIENENIKF